MLVSARRLPAKGLSDRPREAARRGAARGALTVAGPVRAGAARGPCRVGAPTRAGWTAVRSAARRRGSAPNPAPGWPGIASGRGRRPGWRATPEEPAPPGSWPVQSAPARPPLSRTAPRRGGKPSASAASGGHGPSRSGGLTAPAQQRPRVGGSLAQPSRLAAPRAGPPQSAQGSQLRAPHAPPSQPSAGACVGAGPSAALARGERPRPARAAPRPGPPARGADAQDRGLVPRVLTHDLAPLATPA